jgi:PAS domain S-box-containing protein
MRLVTETERLKALHDLKILDTDRERHFDAVCETARDLFGVPVALVTLIDGERAWFKARCGLDVESTPRDVAFCSRTIESDAVLVSEDTRADPRFAANPLVTGAPQVRFYAGAPLILGPGLRVGTLCLIGFAPRDFGAADQQRLRSLADIVVAHLRLHDATVRSEAELAARRTREALIEAQARDLRHGQALLAQTEALADLGTWEFDPDTEEVTWSCNLRRIYDLPADAPVTLETAWAGFEGDDRARIRAAFTDLVGRQRPFEITLPFRSLTGAPRIVRMVGAAEVADGRARRAFGIVQDITDHVAAVSRAQEANRLLLLAEEVARVGHWHVRLPDQHLTWSNEVFNIFGLEPAEGPPARERLRSLFHPDDRALARKLLVGLRDAQRDFDFEARIVRPDDEVRTVLVRGRSEKDETGAVRAYFGVIADITEQKRAEANLRESTALLRVTLDNMDQGLLMVGADDRVQVVNRRALELLGLPEAFMARKPSQLEVREYQMAAGEFERGGATLRRWLDGARMQTDRPVYERERPNGTVLEIRTVPLPGGGAVRTYTDITARRRAEAALAESEARYRLLAEHASDLIVLGHADGRRSYISPAARSMLGYEPDEAMRIGMRDVIHPDDLARVFATTTGLSREAPQGSVVFRMRRKDGRYLFAEAAFTRVEHAGEITIVTAIRDVSERERQAAELTRAKEAAEEAQARAELANEAKTDFLASMSHEIRTPLNGILGYADLLIASPGLDEVQRRSVERIQNAGEALLTVVDDVLDFSKIEAGQVALDPTPFSPKALAGDAVSIVSTVADRKGLPVRVELDPGLPAALLGDEARLRQILLNLLNNAVKFTREGSVTVRLVHGGTTPAGEVITVQVEDTGIGIPAEKQQRLFKRFSQVDGSIRREFGGTGLGLAISRQLVELMGGTIGVASTPGRGSVFMFTVTLPRADEWALHANAAVAAAPAPCPARILLAEDLDINQELARSVLEAVGHQVDVVADGTEAIVAVQARPYDVVLMDVQMPNLDGLAATRLIRALDHPARDVPIIAMTANVLPQQVSACRQAGMTDHVGKPFKRDELYAAIDRALGDERPAPVAAAAAASGALVDESVLAGLEALGGTALAARLLDQFAADLDRRFPPHDLAQIARDAHALVSSAGMLGLMRLSADCAALERACLDGADPVPLLPALRDLAARSLAAARAWQSRSAAAATASAM